MIGGGREEHPGPRVLKGHGTENDFIVLPDPDGTVWPEERLTRAVVRRLC